jgi:RNA polymerase sigma factor (sigma-70 family)
MVTISMTRVIEHLHGALLLRAGNGLDDSELLRNFLERHDEAALATLVKRHGSMVWGLCRRLLSYHDAEDAFQATFLVLVRKATSIVPKEMVGNWLYGVAHQTALQARRTVARRRAREVQVTEMPETEAVQQERWSDVQSLLDQELSHLPNNYRVVIVLCDLEGRTRKEVARQLECRKGQSGVG